MRTIVVDVEIDDHQVEDRADPSAEDVSFDKSVLRSGRSTLIAWFRSAHQRAVAAFHIGDRCVVWEIDARQRRAAQPAK